jgi:hypothetical protein
MAEGRVFVKRDILSKFASDVHATNAKSVLDFILAELNLTAHQVKEDWLRQLNTSLERLSRNAEDRWTKARRIKERYESQNKEWLDSPYEVSDL